MEGEHLKVSFAHPLFLRNSEVRLNTVHLAVAATILLVVAAPTATITVVSVTVY